MLIPKEPKLTMLRQTGVALCDGQNKVAKRVVRGPIRTATLSSGAPGSADGAATYTTIASSRGSITQTHPVAGIRWRTEYYTHLPLQMGAYLR